jgi:hypothetical protein
LQGGEISLPPWTSLLAALRDRPSADPVELIPIEAQG